MLKTKYRIGQKVEVVSKDSPFDPEIGFVSSISAIRAKVVDEEGTIGYGEVPQYYLSDHPVFLSEGQIKTFSENIEVTMEEVCEKFGRTVVIKK